jgi:hypothetical protein
MPRGYLATLALAATIPALAQTAAITSAPKPASPGPRTGIPDYAGARTEVPGIWLPPVANAPFTATVDILTHEKLPNGTEQIRTATNHLARSSSGRIYQERHVLVPVTFQGPSLLLSTHTYDPSSRLSVFTQPQIRLAKQTILSHPPRVIAGHANITIDPKPGPGRTEEDLGTQLYQGLTLQGIRKTHEVSAITSGTGLPLIVSDEYWFSPDLTTYVIIKHNDPRTGEQIITMSHIDRTEPDATIFAIPADFKVVDETPPPPPTQSAAAR